MAELMRYDHVVQILLPSILLTGWNSRLHREPVVGDLVILSSAPPSEWHMSFYRQDCGDGYHLLESLKTGALMRWGNVGFHVIDREKAGIGERAEWTDAQFLFERKFRKVCHRADFYIAIPFIDQFEGDQVFIKFRTRFGFDDKITPVPPFDWRKITQREMLTILRAGEAAHQEMTTATLPKRREE